MRTHTKKISFIGLLVLIGLAFSLQPFVISGAMAADKVFLRLNWKVGGEHAPFIVAWDKGFYKEEGIDITIEEGGGSSATLKTIGAGKETFGMVGNMVSFPGVAKGVPVIQIMLADVGGEEAVITMAKNPATTPQDLKGKKVGGSGATGDAMYKAFLEINGLTEKEVQYVLCGQARFEALLSGRVDAILATPMNDVPRLIEMGAVGDKAPVVLLYRKFGVPQAADGIVCHVDTYNTKKDMIRRFVKASIRGINHTFMNMEDAADRCVKRFPMTDKKTLIIGLQDYKWLQPAPVGWQDPKDAQGLIDLVYKYMGITDIKNIPVNKLYTNEFLPY